MPSIRRCKRNHNAKDMSDQIWYHGSPLQLTVLLQGSTVTQDRRLAEVFSHKPTIVCIKDDGMIQHNGALPGFLYRIVEEVRPEDVHPHPRTTMEPGKEWLTTHDLALALVGSVDIGDKERLTEKEVELLRQRARR